MPDLASQETAPRRPWPRGVKAVLLFLAAGAARAGDPRLPPEVRARVGAFDTEVDPRRMCARELRQLPGIGRRLARAVAEARDGHAGPGPLAWEDVPGIGPVRSAGARAWCADHGVPDGPLVEADPPCSRGYALAMNWRTGTAACLAAWLAGCVDSAPGGDGAASAPPDAAAPAATRTRALHGGALHALERGAEGAPLVVLLHGARFSAATWDELGTLERLAGWGYHALALDWPGFGSTPRWESEPDPHALLAGVCDELGAERIALVAPSMGGRLAFAFVAAAPARVAALVAVAPAGVDPPAPSARAAATLLVWGEGDEVVPLAHGRALAEAIPGARLEVLPGASHPCYLDQPERFHALLEEFLHASFPPVVPR